MTEDKRKLSDQQLEDVAGGLKIESQVGKVTAAEKKKMKMKAKAKNDGK